jgi:hypothetical protein
LLRKGLNEKIKSCPFSRNLPKNIPVSNCSLVNTNCHASGQLFKNGMIPCWHNLLKKQKGMIVG